MFFHFHRHFFHAVWSVKSIFLMLIGLIVLGAFLISVTEAQSFGDALYFASITGLTVGYGDMVATTSIGRVVSVLIGFVGVLFNGLVVAVAVHALQRAWIEVHGSDS